MLSYLLMRGVVVAMPTCELSYYCALIASWAVVKLAWELWLPCLPVSYYCAYLWAVVAMPTCGLLLSLPVSLAVAMLACELWLPCLPVSYYCAYLWAELFRRQLERGHNLLRKNSSVRETKWEERYLSNQGVVGYHHSYWPKQSLSGNK